MWQERRLKNYDKAHPMPEEQESCSESLDFLDSSFYKEKKCKRRDGAFYPV